MLRRSFGTFRQQYHTTLMTSVSTLFKATVHEKSSHHRTWNMVNEILCVDFSFSSSNMRGLQFLPISSCEHPLLSMA
jgi:hypothetical protein